MLGCEQKIFDFDHNCNRKHDILSQIQWSTFVLQSVNRCIRTLRRAWSSNAIMDLRLTLLTALLRRKGGRKTRRDASWKVDILLWIIAYRTTTIVRKFIVFFEFVSQRCDVGSKPISGNFSYVAFSSFSSDSSRLWHDTTSIKVDVDTFFLNRKRRPFDTWTKNKIRTPIFPQCATMREIIY